MKQKQNEDLLQITPREILLEIGFKLKQLKTSLESRNLAERSIAGDYLAVLKHINKKFRNISEIYSIDVFNPLIKATNFKKAFSGKENLKNLIVNTVDEDLPVSTITIHLKNIKKHPQYYIKIQIQFTKSDDDKKLKMIFYNVYPVNVSRPQEEQLITKSIA